MRHAARRDLNDGEISEAVKAAGFSLIDYTKAGLGIPDKLAIKPLPPSRPERRAGVFRLLA